MSSLFLDPAMSQLLRRLLVGLCCALMLLPGGIPSILGIAVAMAAPLAEHEADPAAPSTDDEDESESAPVASPHSLRKTHHLCPTRLLLARYLVHLPHHHVGQAGFDLPVCSPFARGVSPPLHC